MKSPITGKDMKLNKASASLSYRKDVFIIMYHYYLCNDTNERFTDDGLDNINQIQVHNKYREKYGIPFPEEITRIREKYGVSASKMSEILGFGANTYRLYETGEMPSVANGRLILSIKQPLEFIKQVEASSHILTPKEKIKFLVAAEILQKKELANFWNTLFEQHIFSIQTPNEYTGYKKPDLTKIAKVIAFFDQQPMKLFKTKLNKLLFYSDFGLYKKTGFSMTGIAYKAIPFGPVPENYDKLYLKLCDDEKINITPVLVGNDNYAEEIKTCGSFDEEDFNPIELYVLNVVANAFKSQVTEFIVNKSHEEAGWIDNEKDKQLISYQKYAYDLKGINVD